LEFMMPYTYDYDEPNHLGTLKLDGVALFTVDSEINPRLHGHLATPMWLAALNAGDGSVDAANKRVQITSIALDEIAKTEDQRDEVVALLTDFAAEIEANTGWSTARSRWFIRFLWRFTKRALHLMGRL